jgi:methyltransferase (TIGR00027 family)
VYFLIWLLNQTPKCAIKHGRQIQSTREEIGMEENKVSITALVCGFTRAYHATNDSPKIFDDFFASKLFTSEEISFFGSRLADMLRLYDPQAAEEAPDETTALRLIMQTYNSSTILGRARFTEDCLEKAINEGLEQYVILGAGMDTFAQRRPELADRLQVFEVDHPATQANKQERLLRVSAELPKNLHLVPVIFGKDDLNASLLKAGYDPAKPGFFSWLGVTYYLDRNAIQATLQNLSELSIPGSMLVFDYSNNNDNLPESISHRSKVTHSITRQTGEPMKTSFVPADLENDLRQYRFATVENLTPDEIENRYFSNRNDLYHAFENVHFMHAKSE